MSSLPLAVMTTGSDIPLLRPRQANVEQAGVEWALASNEGRRSGRIGGLAHAKGLPGRRPDAHEPRSTRLV